jgi:hypothetical protein
MAAGLRYIASEKTTQKTPLPAVVLLLGDVAIPADGTENTVPLFHVQSFLRWLVVYCAVI